MSTDPEAKTDWDLMTLDHESSETMPAELLLGNRSATKHSAYSRWLGNQIDKLQSLFGTEDAFAR